jgi:hypothetical protein
LPDHFLSTNKEQRVLQFIRLPIEDTFLGDMQDNWWPARFSDPKLTLISPIHMMKESGPKEVPHPNASNAGVRYGTPSQNGDRSAYLYLLPYSYYAIWWPNRNCGGSHFRERPVAFKIRSALRPFPGHRLFLVGRLAPFVLRKFNRSDFVS